MPETIKDGQGKGYVAGVTDQFRLKVESKSRPSEEVEAQEGRGFILHAECHLALATNGGLLYFKNADSTKEIVITRIYIDPHILTNTDIIITQIKNPTVVNGTDITTTGIINKNFRNQETLTGALVVSDGSSNMTYSNGSQYHAFPVQSMVSQTRDMKGTNVITPNTNICWG